MQKCRIESCVYEAEYRLEKKDHYIALYSQDGDLCLKCVTYLIMTSYDLERYK